MQQIGNVAQQVYSYSNSKRPKGLSIAIEEKLTKKQEDEILDSYPQLISQEYRGWCVKKLRIRGKKEFIKLADRALKYGRDPQKMFVHLLM